MKSSTIALVESSSHLEWESICMCRLRAELAFSQSFRECVKNLQSEEWANFRLRVSGRNLAVIRKKDYESYLRWNPVVREVKSMLNEVFGRVQLTRYCNNIGGGAIASISWDILHCAMEEEFRGLLDSKFYSEQILPVYRAGKLPVGWDGPIPNEAWSANPSLPLPVGSIVVACGDKV